ncbi:MAG: RNA methyltransferase [Sandaracinaceae bacterium]|nr:RNA methyltransferase [Sandaracinaceae bacterium]MDW8247151.1 RNA methyltransferase [Sandaracinaceae bacterium]
MRRNLPEVAEIEASQELPFPPELIIEALSPLLTPARLKRFREVLAKRIGSLIPVLDGLSDPHNGAAVLRSAEAFGCQEVHIVHGKLPFAYSSHVSRHTERWLDVHIHTRAEEVVHLLTQRGFALFIADMQGEAELKELSAIPKLAVVFGNEHGGISPIFRIHAHGSFRIPMAGFVESLNVSVAAAITLFVASQGRHGDLDEASQKRVLARWLLRQIQNSEAIVRKHMSAKQDEESIGQS